MIDLPDNFLGGDLFWWRSESELNTLISIFWGHYQIGTEPVNFEFLLFDECGKCRARWSKQIYQDTFIVLDSGDLLTVPDEAQDVQSGVLAVLVSTSAPPSERLKEQYRRLYSIVDWYSDQGEICTLHNDHSIVFGEKEIELTEIVLREETGKRNSLVIINGVSSQRQEALAVVVRNTLGERLHATYQPKMSPFSVNQIYLDELFPNLTSFVGKDHYTVEGKILAKDLYFRPYVVTEGEYLNAYHGGDRYSWGVFPELLYKFLGRGEVNPMAAIENKELSTTVNILNSHGALEEDFWVDARLYGPNGELVAERQRWLCAKRHAVSRGSVKDLINGIEELEGHIALSFSPDERENYPVRLQALLEYQTKFNVSRVMAWSDEWNSKRRTLERGDSLYRKYFRVWNTDVLKTYLSIYNCGVEPDYQQVADLTLLLRNENGDSLKWEGRIEPNGSLYRRIDEIFEIPESFMQGGKVVMVESITASDLAHVQITKHYRSGVQAAEHFLVLHLDQNGNYCRPAGG